ncbi:hypothetical protein ZIOFF_062196 [Zingiber officinale]|uniref:Uncharacterized protein n=1 Tax=Zingiber officinale TaxID=94328 RepID=A0A8J5KEB6_ZINOF|nr:hypothetical protein ZIOFF_062196 [Zingiber officinale]
MSGHLQPVFRLNTGAIIREGIVVLPSVKVEYETPMEMVLVMTIEPGFGTRIEEKFPNLDVEGYMDKYVKV